MGIATATFAVRALMIPVLLPLAVRTRERQRIVRKIKPQIKELDRRFRDDPGTLTKRLKALHAEHGISMVDWPGLVAALVQVPLLIAMFQAVLTLRPSEALTASGIATGLAAAALSTFGTRVSGQAEGASWMLWMSAILPLAICLWLGAGIGFYLGGFYGAGALQALAMRRDKALPAALEPGG